MSLRTIKRNIVGAVILSSDGKLLLGRHFKSGVYFNYWVIPGGGIEPDETKINALKREVKEETGIDITGAEIRQIEGVSNGQSEKVLSETGEKVLVDMNFYNFKITLPEKTDEIELVHEDDFTGAQWFDVKDISGLKLSPPTRTALQNIGLL